MASRLLARVPLLAGRALAVPVMKAAGQSALSAAVRPAASGPIAAWTRAFSATPRAANKGAELSDFLKSEIAYEKENAEEAPAIPKGFQINDQHGVSEVTLKSKQGDEEVTVLFEVMKQEDPDLLEETDEDGEKPDNSPYAPFQVFVTKKTSSGDDAGTLVFELIADDGEIYIDGIVFSKDSSVALGDSADADWKRSGFYPGPNFNALPEEMQTMWFEYLDQRGINNSLAEFIPAYMDYKENQEYIRWLKSVEGFLSHKSK